MKKYLTIALLLFVPALSFADTLSTYTTDAQSMTFCNSSGRYDIAQSFTLPSDANITSVSITSGANSGGGTPSTVQSYIDSDNSGFPSNVGPTYGYTGSQTWTASGVNTFDYSADTTTYTAGTTYWLVIACDDYSLVTKPTARRDNTTGYANGRGVRNDVSGTWYDLDIDPNLLDLVVTITYTPISSGAPVIGTQALIETASTSFNNVTGLSFSSVVDVGKSYLLIEAGLMLALFDQLWPYILGVTSLTVAIWLSYKGFKGLRR